MESDSISSRKTFSFQGTKRGRGAARKMYLFFLAPISSRRNAGPWRAARGGAGPGRAQPPRSGYSRRPRDVEELGAAARGVTGLARLLRIQRGCINSLVVGSRARSPHFAQKTRKRGGAAGFQGASFAELSSICSIPSLGAGLGVGEPILTHRPGTSGQGIPARRGLFRVRGSSGEHLLESKRFPALKSRIGASRSLPPPLG